MNKEELLNKVGEILENKYKYPCPNMKVEYIQAVVLATEQAINLTGCSLELRDIKEKDNRKRKDLMIEATRGISCM